MKILSSIALIVFYGSIACSHLNKKKWYSSFDEASNNIDKPHNCRILIKTIHKAGVEKFEIFPLMLESEKNCKEAMEPYKIKTSTYVLSKDVQAIWLGK